MIIFLIISWPFYIRGNYRETKPSSGQNLLVPNRSKEQSSNISNPNVWATIGPPRIRWVCRAQATEAQLPTEERSHMP